MAPALLVQVLVQALVFAAAMAALQHADVTNVTDVTAVAWAGLYLCSALATVALPRWVPLNAAGWLAAAGCALLFSAMFWGANFGLDALHGAHRHKADVAQYLGGLELWLALCPGVVSAALGAAVQVWWTRPRHRVTNIRIPMALTNEAPPTAATLASSKDTP